MPTAHSVFGALGTVFSFCLFLSPMSTFVTIVRNKSVEQFSPITYLGSLLSCMVSIIYGLPTVHPNSIPVLVMNSLGVILEGLWIGIYIVFCPHRLRLKILGAVAVELLLAGAILAGVLCGAHTYHKRTQIAGILNLVFNIVMYLSPLSIMRTVIRTKSVKYMPLSVSLMGLLSTIFWMIYSLIQFDLYILVSNALGALLSAGQLFLYFFYYCTTPKDEPRQNAGQNVELPATNAHDS